MVFSYYKYFGEKVWFQGLMYFKDRCICFCFLMSLHFAQHLLISHGSLKNKGVHMSKFFLDCNTEDLESNFKNCFNKSCVLQPRKILLIWTPFINKRILLICPPFFVHMTTTSVLKSRKILFIWPSPGVHYSVLF